VVKWNFCNCGRFIKVVRLKYEAVGSIVPISRWRVFYRSVRLERKGRL
jgi:hypothetical protein